MPMTVFNRNIEYRDHIHKLYEEKKYYPILLSTQQVLLFFTCYTASVLSAHSSLFSVSSEAFIKLLKIGWALVGFERNSG